MSNGTALQKTALWVHKKSNFEFPYYPAIPLLGIHSRELKTYVHTKYVYSMEYYPVKKKSADTYTTRTLKTLLSGISQTQKDKYRMMPLI